MRRIRFLTCVSLLFLSCASVASAELLALLNYESKPNQPVRREGIAIMEIDPESADFGKILMEVPLPPDLVAHHIFFNRDRTKAYITALNKSDALDAKTLANRRRSLEKASGGKVHVLSGVSGEGVQAVLRALWAIIAEGRQAVSGPRETTWRP